MRTRRLPNGLRLALHFFIAKCDTLGGSQEITVINESGLYSLILLSAGCLRILPEKVLESRDSTTISSRRVSAIKVHLTMIAGDSGKMIEYWLGTSARQLKR